MTDRTRPRRLRRSKLFVPGNRPDLAVKALASKADGITLDLEDAVAEDQKDFARRTVSQILEEPGTHGKEISVRVNPIDGERFIEDVLGVVRLGLSILNVPKIEEAYEMRFAENILRHAERKTGLEVGNILLVPTLESPKGLRQALEIALSSPRICALQLGTGDLKAATGLVPDTARLGPIRTMLLLACAEAGIDALDSAFVHIDDPDGFRADAAEARLLGFRGKSCIHPSQVALANEIFAPTAAELAYAADLVRAYDEGVAGGRGAIQHRGKLVDYPIAEEARRLLADAVQNPGTR